MENQSITEFLHSVTRKVETRHSPSRKVFFYSVLMLGDYQHASEGPFPQQKEVRVEADLTHLLTPHQSEWPRDAIAAKQQSCLEQHRYKLRHLHEGSAEASSGAFVLLRKDRSPTVFS